MRWFLALLAGILAGAALAAPSSLVLGFARNTSQPAKSAESFVDSVGVNIHVDYFDTAYGNYPIIREKLSALGLRHIRVGAHLSGNPDRDRIIYGRYRDLTALGIKSSLVVDPRNPNLRSVDADKIRRIAEMTEPALESFEGPNEYDISGDDDWVSVLRSYQQDLYEAVKDNSTTANVPVIGPSMAHAYNAPQLGDLSAHLDYGNMHPYPGGENPGSWTLDDYNIEHSRSISAGKPLIPTETGYHNALNSDGEHAGVPEAVAGKYMPRLFLEHFNRGIPRTYLYELIDLFPDSNRDDQESNFGLLRHDGSEKPAFVALENLLGLLEEEPEAPFTPGSLDYSLSGETEDVHRALLQKRDGRFYLVLWVEKPGYDIDTRQEIPVPEQRVNLTLNQPIQQAATYRPNNSAAPTGQYTAPTQLALDVPDHPLVVEFTPSPALSETAEPS